MREIILPEAVGQIIDTLGSSGFAAYAVGGCVRDSLMGCVPHDWDIATSALPEQVKRCFPQNTVLETGLRHGTVTVVIDHQPYEITTFRVDGEYRDNRRPEQVRFTPSLEEDLRRRDFTVNAMAYSPSAGLVDSLGGRRDLENRVIRCVGNPDTRFGEDGLRILRALRFASVLGFAIEEQTGESIHQNKHLLRGISAERISAELCGLLCGVDAGRILLDYPDVLAEFLPEILPMVGFAQNNPHHHLDVWAHTAQAVHHAPAVPHLRLAMLLHDIGKPGCYSESGGIGHFYGHPAAGEALAESILRRLKLDNKTLSAVKLLVRHHDTGIPPTERAVKRCLNKLGEPLFRDLLQIKRADRKAQAPAYREEGLAQVDALEAVANLVLEQQQCFCLRDLAVDGNDLIREGIPKGRAVGEMLQFLLEQVMEGALPNEQQPLLQAAGQAAHGELPNKTE